jgi:phenol 2-monooxygenase
VQFHHDGFRPGDPELAEPAADIEVRDPVDVLIVGTGPTGLTLAAQLSRFGEIRTRIVERRPGPLRVGQADGIACRSMEMFQAFGFADKVMKEAYFVNEVTFWRPGPDGVGIVRADRIQDVEDDLSEMPHVILSQARVHDFLLEMMRKSPRRLVPDYGVELRDLKRTRSDDYPVEAVLVRVDDGSEETVRCRYLVGCDGAHSTVRKLLGFPMKGEGARQLWGVMDVLAVTDFPDIRLKSAIRSAAKGSLLIIPREGGFMVRMYMELDELAEGERASDRNLSPEALVAKANEILDPYTLEVRQVAWWSAYEIGQRLCDRFDDSEQGEPRVFIAGDACHTHSPKAGQGMNVSMADAFNLGWKLASVLKGQAHPSLLVTYSEERRAKAKELIDFDRDMARLFSEGARDPAKAEEFERYFKKHARYTAGVETRYDPSLLVMHPAHQDLARGLVVGMRFHSAPVIRLADAKPMHLGHVIEADGRWRLLAFAPADDTGAPGGAIARLCSFLAEDPTSPLRLYTSPGQDVDAVIDLRAVFQQHHRALTIPQMPPLLRPFKGRLRLVDYEKVFCPDLVRGPDIFDLRGIDRRRGALVVVRPDQYVAGVLPLDAHAELSGFFSRFMLPQVRSSSGHPTPTGSGR